MRCEWKNFYGETCEGKLVLIPEQYPWVEEHYQCDCCDSTFNTDYIHKRKIKILEKLKAPVLATDSNGKTHNG